jgi:membrane-associated protein
MIDILLHLDQYLNQWSAQLGPWLYVVIFLVIFCETGLVFTPFLPGDSLLFALGALCATEGTTLNLPLVCLIIIGAAFLGDISNYTIGFWFGEKLVAKNLRIFNKKHLLKTQDFFARNGGKTVIMARFVPIVRTFAPFVAGLGKMKFKTFISFSVFGTTMWVLICALGGYFFGNIPIVKKNFELAILGIIFVSLLPMIFELLRSRLKSTRRSAS